ncbi:hypothetical protein TBR22_A00740 [Luteitalea sp. TBR-22]|nr:hypothetical protein TBR22_A00740 [Luteitalea sp. TBR-22]
MRADLGAGPALARQGGVAEGADHDEERQELRESVQHARQSRARLLRNDEGADRRGAPTGANARSV